MSTKLARIAEKAASNPTLRFTSLAHLLTPGFLTETWAQMNQKGASGVDGETMAEFERDLDARVTALSERVAAGKYRAPPVRRVEIPKGEGKTRPLGIPTVEDRLLQRAVARLLTAVLEPNFLECSYGFRPGRNPHDALRALRSHLIGGKVMHVFEADIRGYFNHINHQWLQRMVALHIGDPRIQRLIGKWLRAGVMDGGIVTRSEEGTPQGGPISPLLANLYLHYVLDLWFERRFRPRCRGEAYLVRFADDFVACFQFEHEAAEFGRALEERMRKFGLELAQEKTRRMLFGRFARERLEPVGRKPETFDFLGFTHVCGTDRQGKFALVRLPSRKSIRKFLDRVRLWLQGEKMHWKVRDQQRHLASMLRGFYQYFALPHCSKKLSGVQLEVKRQWRRSLLRRGQRSRLHWSVLAKQQWFQLPTPRSLHPTV